MKSDVSTVLRKAQGAAGARGRAMDSETICKVLLVGRPRYQHLCQSVLRMGSNRAKR